MSVDVVNIGDRERRKRRIMGLVALACGVALAFVFIVYDAHRALRLIVFLPLWFAGLGLLQSREKT